MSLTDAMVSFFNKGTPAAPLSVSQGVAVAANILNGRNNTTVTTAATTLITIPAGRTWAGEIGASCSCDDAAATTGEGRANVVFSLSGTGSTPAPGNIFGVDARSGANAATGTVGSQGNNFGKMAIVIVAGVNPVLVQSTTIQAGSGSQVDAFASGQLVV